MEGREATTFQPITVRGNQPISLDQVANLSHSELAGLLRDYLGRVSSLLPQVPLLHNACCSDPLASKARHFQHCKKFKVFYLSISSYISVL